MKKFYASAAALLIAAQAFALSEPMIIDNMMIRSITSDCKHALFDDQFGKIISLYNLDTKNLIWANEDLGLTSAMRRSISDNLVFVGSTESSIGYYIKSDGVPHELTLPEGYEMGYPNSISNDGQMIVGALFQEAMSIDAGNIMVVPCIWEADGNGGYKTPEILPYPTKDWTGATPQYVQCMDVSDDTSVIIGQMTANDGFSNQIVVWRKGNEGWSYETIHDELLNPEEVVIPAWPGEEPKKPKFQDYMSEEEIARYDAAVEAFNSRPQPQTVDFMTEEKRAEYEAALAEYMADPMNVPYPAPDAYMTEEELKAYYEAVDAYWSAPRPDPAEYMTDENKTAYNNALEAYQTLYDEWEPKYQAWQDAMWQALETGVAFDQGSFSISPNGQLGLAVSSQSDPWTGVSKMVNYVFSLEGSDYWTTEGGLDFYGNSISNDGGVLGFAGSAMDAYSRQAAFSPEPGDPGVLLYDFMESFDATIHTWMTENMTHNVPELDPETWEVVYVDKVMTGTPCADDNLQIVGLYVLNSWDENEEAPLYYSYLIPTNGLGGIRGISADAKKADLAVALNKDGSLSINGTAKRVAIYDLNGRVVFSTDAPADGLATGLKQGAYVVKATGADKESVSKAII